MADGGRPVTGLPPRFTLTTLGGWSLVAETAPIGTVPPLGPSKPLALVVYLALAPGRAARRELLLDLLWADREPTAALHALRQTLWLLRQRVGDGFLASSGTEVRLAADVAVDRDAFVSAVEARDWERAAALYRGEFLPGFAAPGGADFERWADLERDRLRGMFTSAGLAHVRRLLDASRFNDAVALARRVRDSDRDREAGWRSVIEALCAGGAILRAAVEADALERLLREENREAEPATRAVLRLARQLSGPEGGGSRPPESDRGTHPRARRLVTELVGREREFSAILRAWEAARGGAARHVHVTAPAGLGKSRLLGDLHRRLRSGGANAVLLRAHPGEHPIPFAFASDLAAALAALPGAAAVSPAAAAALVALDPSLSTRYPAASPDPAVGDEALRRRTLALAELADAVADEAPLALLIDDIHWCDAASRVALNGIATRLAGSPVLMVTTARPSHEPVVARETTEHLGLAPLTPQEIGALVGGLGALPAEPWAADFPARLELATHGSPLLIVETLQLLLERGLLTLTEQGWDCADAQGVADALSEGSALRRRLAELNRDQRWLVLVLSVAGSPVGPSRIAAHSTRPEEALAADFAELEQRGFVTRAGDGWMPAHDEVARAAVEGAAPEALRAACLAVGRAAVAEAARDPMLLVRAGHFLARAGERGEASQAFARWFVQLRRRGDRRPTAVLASEFLGSGATRAETRTLVRLLPALVRVGLFSTARRAAAAAGLLLAAALLSRIALTPAPPPPDEELFAIPEARERPASTAYRVPIRVDRWSDQRPLDAAVAGTPYATVRTPRGWDVNAVYSSARGAWALRRDLPGSQELFLIRDDGTERQLTSSAGDDIDPSWAPDGWRLAFATGRWSSLNWYHIAVLDPDHPDSVRQLTRGDASDRFPRWEPLGARIAFLRRYPEAPDRPQELCWTTLEGSDPVCVRLGGDFRITGLSKWLNASHLGAVVDSAGKRAFVSVGVDDGSVTVIRGNTVSVGLSPDGRWAAGVEAEGENAGSWEVYPVARPDLAVRVMLAGRTDGFVLHWGKARTPPPYIDRLVVDTVPQRLPIGAPQRLAARGVTMLRDTVPIPAERWWTSDSSVALVDDSGLATGLRRGTTWLHVTAGGWRTDSVRVVVDSATDHTVIRETWASGDTTDWRPYGSPLPEVTEGPGGVPALWNRGEGKYNSGVYLRRRIDPSEGLGVEAAFSSPVTAVQWQVLSVELAADVDEDSLARWNHLDGPVPRLSAWPGGMGICESSVPSGEGADRMARIGFGTDLSSAEAPLPPADLTGRWYRVRLQLFPDGHCGVAVDGKPVWMSPARLRMGRPFRVLLYGNSHGARMLFGPVEVWQGVKPGMDWAALSRPTAREARAGRRTVAGGRPAP